MARTPHLIIMAAWSLDPDTDKAVGDIAGALKDHPGGLVPASGGIVSLVNRPDEDAGLRRLLRSIQLDDAIPTPEVE